MSFWDSIKQLPLEEFRHKLDTFDKEFLNLSDTELEVLFSELGVGAVTYAFDLSPNICLFRGVKYNNKPELKSQLSYPPLSLARQNRANKKGESIFYCCSAKEAVFYELDLKPGDKIALSAWVVQKPIMVNNLSFMLPNISRFGLIKDFNEEKLEHLKANVDNLKLQTQYLFDFVIETFCKKIERTQEKEYRKTQAIAKLYLQNPFQGLIYPTIKLDGSADNFAIKPFVIESEFLGLTSVEFIEIIDTENNNYTYKILDYCDTIDNDNLHWYDFSTTWTTSCNSEKEIVFVNESSEILAYDQYGDLILPDN